jgi:hypothetical protein
MTADELKKVFSNPFYCLEQVDEIFVQPHETLVSEETWIKTNENLMKEIGQKKWLEMLLENLKGNYVR